MHSLVLEQIVENFDRFCEHLHDILRTFTWYFANIYMILHDITWYTSFVFPNIIWNFAKSINLKMSRTRSYEVFRCLALCVPIGVSRTQLYAALWCCYTTCRFFVRRTKFIFHCCASKYLFTYSHTCIYICILIFTHLHICVYICIYIRSFPFFCHRAQSSSSLI